MSLNLSMIGAETIAVAFPYDAHKVSLIKLLPRRRWNPRHKRWEVHLSHLPELLRIFGLERGALDPALLAAYDSQFADSRLRVRLGPLKGRLSGSGAPLEAIDKATSFAVAGARYAASFKSGEWDGRKHLFDARSQSFPAGLWPAIQAILDKAGLEYLLELEPPPPVQAPPLAAGPVRVALRPYQQAALAAALEHGRGIIQIATGGGKTMLAAHLIRQLDRPALFLVHTLDLLYQAARVFERELGLEVGILGDGQARLRPLTVATIQTVASACAGTRPARSPRPAAGEEELREERPVHLDDASRRQVIDQLESVPVVIFDECHHVPADTFYRIAMRTGAATRRYGLSATPWRDDGCDLLLEAALGRCIHATSASDLIEQGFLVPPRIQMLPAPLVRLKPRLSYPDCYQQAIVENQERNRVIATQARAWAAEGLSVLVLVAQVTHGEALARCLPEARFVHGSLDSALRRQYLDELERKLHPIMIATTLADEGLDLPTLDGLILAGGGKSQTRAFQRIGRTLRPAPAKREARVLDFLDEAPWLREHGMARLQLYRQEPCFKIQMLRRESRCTTGS